MTISARKIQGFIRQEAPNPPKTPPSTRSVKLRYIEANQRPQSSELHFVTIAQAVFTAGGQLEAVDAGTVGAAQIFNIQPTLVPGNGRVLAGDTALIRAKRPQVKADRLLIFPIRCATNNHHVLQVEGNFLLPNLELQAPRRAEDVGLWTGGAIFHRPGIRCIQITCLSFRFIIV
jgi:hypothetical protein